MATIEVHGGDFVAGSATYFFGLMGLRTAESGASVVPILTAIWPPSIS